MLPVIVLVENLETKSSAQHVFRRSPVHIGRNKLNELPLSAPFVSLWHGMLRFDEKGLEYMDLNSTNGTEVDGQRAKGNLFVPVNEQTDLKIGTLRLHLSRGEAAAAEPERDLTLFGQRTLYMGLQEAATAGPGAPATKTMAFKPAARATPVSPAIARPRPEELSPGAVAGSLFLLYENYRQAWRTLHSQLTAKLAALPEAQRGATLQVLRQRFPALDQEEQFRALGASPEGNETLVRAGEAGVVAAAQATPAAPRTQTHGATEPGSLTLLRTGLPSEKVFVGNAAAEEQGNGQDLTLLDAPPIPLVTPVAREPALPPGSDPNRVTLWTAKPAMPPSPAVPLEAVDPSRSLLRIFAQTYGAESAEIRSAVDLQRFLNQLSAVLEAFAKAFLELRRGHDQFGKEVAVPMVGDQTPLRHAKTPRDVLRYLLDCNGHGAERIQALTQGFADVMIHQVALLNGIRQGIGALLAHLSPDQLERSSPLSRNGAGTLLLKIWPARAMALWGRYIARHQELVQEERVLQSFVFGTEFAFAYAQIVGGNAAPPVGSKAAPANGGSRRRANA